MASFFKRLLKDRRGNALVIAGMSLPLIVGAAGLGTDTIQWVVWKRELQRAADSAAFAGVYAQVQDNAGMTAAQAVAADLGTNNHTKATMLATYPRLAYPSGGGFTDAVQVTLAVQKPLGFSGLFLRNPPTIITSATAAVVEDGTYCVVALAPEGSGIEIGGSANVTMGCGAISNSIDGTDAVNVNGDAHTFVATPVAAVGAIDGTINGSPTLRPYSLPMEDPYAGLDTSVPSDMPCTNFNSHIVSQTGPNGNGGQVTLSPGCFTTFNLGNHTYTLQEGTYYLDSANLVMNGSTTLIGEGVTIVLTGSNPGTVSMNGTSTINLTGPTSGDFANLVLVQSANANVGNNNTINGSNSSSLDGAIYFPSGDVTLTGSTGQAFQCAMVVGYTVAFSGSATVQNDISGCETDTQVTGRRVRLIA